MTQPINPCEHGTLARYVLVMDLALRNPLNEWGDIELMRITGPEMLAAAKQIRDHEADDHHDEPGRFVLGFIHTDGCRTEEIR